MGVYGGRILTLSRWRAWAKRDIRICSGSSQELSVVVERINKRYDNQPNRWRPLHSVWKCSLLSHSTFLFTVVWLISQHSYGWPWAWRAVEGRHLPCLSQHPINATRGYSRGNHSLPCGSPAHTLQFALYHWLWDEPRDPVLSQSEPHTLRARVTG